jgi:hypothetical protein
VKLVAFFGARLNHGAVCRSLQRVTVAYQCGCYHSCATPGEFTVSDQVQFVAWDAVGICAKCGSTLTCESERLPTETHFHVGAFD